MSTSTSGPAAHSRRASRNHRSSVRSSISAAFFSTPEEGEAVITAEPDPDLDDTSLLPHPGVVLKVKPLQKVPKNISIYVNLCSSTHHRLLRDGAKDVKIDPTGQGGPSDAATALDDDAASVKSAATGASSAPEMVIFAGPRRVRKEGTTINHIYDVVVHESELSCLVTRKTVGSAVITDLNKLRDVCSCCIRVINAVNPGAELKTENFTLPNVKDGYKFCSDDKKPAKFLLPVDGDVQQPNIPASPVSNRTAQKQECQDEDPSSYHSTTSEPPSPFRGHEAGNGSATVATGAGAGVRSLSAVWDRADTGQIDAPSAISPLASAANSPLRPPTINRDGGTDGRHVSADEFSKFSDPRDGHERQAMDEFSSKSDLREHSGAPLTPAYTPNSSAFGPPADTRVDADTPPDRYVTPVPGVVIKIKRHGNVKIFVNLCSHDEMPLSSHPGVTLVSVGPKRTLLPIATGGGNVNGSVGGSATGDESSFVFDALIHTEVMSAVQRIESATGDFEALRALCSKVLKFMDENGSLDEFGPKIITDNANNSDRSVVAGTDGAARSPLPGPSRSPPAADAFTLPNTKGHYKSTATAEGAGAVLAANGAIVAPFLVPKPAYMVLEALAAVGGEVAVRDNGPATDNGSDTQTDPGATLAKAKGKKSLKHKVSLFLGLTKKTQKSTQNVDKTGETVPDVDVSTAPAPASAPVSTPQARPVERDSTVFLPVAGICAHVMDGDSTVFVNICSCMDIPERMGEAYDPNPNPNAAQMSPHEHRKPVILVGNPRFVGNARVLDVVMRRAIPHGKALKICQKVLKLLQSRGDIQGGADCHFTIASLQDRRALGLGPSIYKNTTTEHLGGKFRYMSTEGGKVSPFVAPNEVMLDKLATAIHNPNAIPHAPLVSAVKGGRKRAPSHDGSHTKHASASASASGSGSAPAGAHPRREMYASYYTDFAPAPAPAPVTHGPDQRQGQSQDQGQRQDRAPSGSSSGGESEGVRIGTVPADSDRRRAGTDDSVSAATTSGAVDRSRPPPLTHVVPQDSAQPTAAGSPVPDVSPTPTHSSLTLTPTTLTPTPCVVFLTRTHPSGQALYVNICSHPLIPRSKSNKPIIIVGSVQPLSAGHQESGPGSVVDVVMHPSFRVTNREGKDQYAFKLCQKVLRYLERKLEFKHDATASDDGLTICTLEHNYKFADSRSEVSSFILPLEPEGALSAPRAGKAAKSATFSPLLDAPAGFQRAGATGAVPLQAHAAGANGTDATTAPAAHSTVTRSPAASRPGGNGRDVPSAMGRWFGVSPPNSPPAGARDQSKNLTVDPASRPRGDISKGGADKEAHHGLDRPDTGNGTGAATGASTETSCVSGTDPGPDAGTAAAEAGTGKSRASIYSKLGMTFVSERLASRSARKKARAEELASERRRLDAAMESSLSHHARSAAFNCPTKVQAADKAPSMPPQVQAPPEPVCAPAVTKEMFLLALFRFARYEIAARRISGLAMGAELRRQQEAEAEAAQQKQTALAAAAARKRAKDEAAAAAAVDAAAEAERAAALRVKSKTERRRSSVFAYMFGAVDDEAPAEAAEAEAEEAVAAAVEHADPHADPAGGLDPDTANKLAAAEAAAEAEIAHQRVLKAEIDRKLALAEAEAEAEVERIKAEIARKLALAEAEAGVEPGAVKAEWEVNTDSSQPQAAHQQTQAQSEAHAPAGGGEGVFSSFARRASSIFVGAPSGILPPGTASTSTSREASPSPNPPLISSGATAMDTPVDPEAQQIALRKAARAAEVAQLKASGEVAAAGAVKTAQNRLQEQRRREAAVAAAAEAELEAKRVRLEEERLAAEAEAERVRLEERLAAEAEAERVHLEEERLAAEVEAEAERVRLEEERLAAEAEAERVRLEEERLVAEAEAEAERVRLEEERLVAEAETEAEAERVHLEEERLVAEVEAEAERVRLEEERLVAEAETEAEAERVRLEEERLAAEAEAERVRLEEERLAAEAAAQLVATTATAAIDPAPAPAPSADSVAASAPAAGPAPSVADLAAVQRRPSPSPGTVEASHPHLLPHRRASLSGAAAAAVRRQSATGRRPSFLQSQQDIQDSDDEAGAEEEEEEEEEEAGVYNALEEEGDLSVVEEEADSDDEK